MNKKPAFIAPFLALGLVIAVLFVAIVAFAPQVKNLGLLSLKKNKQESEAAGTKKEFKIKNDRGDSLASPKASPTSLASVVPSPISTPTPLPPTIYRQPQGKYTLTLPSGWKVLETTAAKTYSTTKFGGQGGQVSVTFGSGKDPIGGCSETTQVTLYDRTISACFILQKDGSQIMTRGYTKDVTGIDFTVEAIFSSPLSLNRSFVLDIIKTLNIE